MRVKSAQVIGVAGCPPLLEIVRNSTAQSKFYYFWTVCRIRARIYRALRPRGYGYYKLVVDQWGSWRTACGDRGHWKLSGPRREWGHLVSTASNNMRRTRGTQDAPGIMAGGITGGVQRSLPEHSLTCALLGGRGGYVSREQRAAGLQFHNPTIRVGTVKCQ